MHIRSLACGVAMLLAPVSAHAVQATQFTRDDARAIIANVQKIVSPDGIDTKAAVPINGTMQWITVRGRDLRNPILLFIHGGPAAPEMPTSWTFQNDWEDFFTVVQWDQRGSGKTYAANDPAKVKPTLTVARMEQDTAELMQYLRAKYGKDKIFVIGHSWGTVLGLKLAQEHPEWLYAYIGMGQIIDMRESEQRDYESALASAKADHNQKAIQQLEAIAPYPNPQRAPTFDEIGVE